MSDEPQSPAPLICYPVSPPSIDQEYDDEVLADTLLKCLLADGPLPQWVIDRAFDWDAMLDASGLPGGCHMSHKTKGVTDPQMVAVLILGGVVMAATAAFMVAFPPPGGWW